jgi:hypothetical protein
MLAKAVFKGLASIYLFKWRRLPAGSRPARALFLAHPGDWPPRAAPCPAFPHREQVG